MKKVTNVKVTTYAVDSEFFVDIVETDEYFHAYIYREYSSKSRMYCMKKDFVSKEDFVKKVECDAPGFESIHDRECEWLEEIPDCWYDDEDDGCDDDHNCENCEHHGDCEYEELRGITIEMPELHGDEEECKEAVEIRSKFISWMNTAFFTKHPLPMVRFQQWYLRRHTSASYWITNQESLFDMFFMADSIAEWRSEE